MEMNMTLQFSSIWMALLTGLGLAVLYDCFRILRTTVTGGTGHSSIQDFFFMLFCGLVTYLLALATDFGYVRFYLVACEVIGACVYFLTVGAVTHRIARWLHRIYLWILRQLHRFLVRPIRFCWKKLVAAGAKIGKCVEKNVKNRAKKRKNPLKSRIGLVYNQTVSVWKVKTGKLRVKSPYGEGKHEQKHQSDRREKEQKKS